MTEASTHVPAPGSRMEAAAAAAAHEAAPAAPPAPSDEGLPVVGTRDEMPEECVPRTLMLSASNPYLPLAPRDMRRRRLIITPVVNDVIICETRELAQQIAAALSAGQTAASLGIGAYIPVGRVIDLQSRDWLWAAVTTLAGTSPLTVIAERYAAGL